MAGDVCWFGRIGEVRACWCPQGLRPTVPKQQVRQYVYAYAAVAPELGKMTCLTLPYANTKMMNLFLSQISEEFADYFVTNLATKIKRGLHREARLEKMGERLNQTDTPLDLTDPSKNVPPFFLRQIPIPR